MDQAKELNIDVIGVIFHVESRCTDPETFIQSCLITTVSLPWEQKLVSACICLILVVAFLDLRIGSSNLKRSLALDTYFYQTLG